VVVTVALGGPLVELAPAVAPSAVSAFLKAAIVMEPCHEPLERVAVTVVAVSGPGATACQISAVPAWVFWRLRRVQVRPPPETPLNEMVPLPLGPSELRKARISSFDCVVVMAGEVIVVPAVLWWVMTWASTLMTDGPEGTVALAALEAGPTLPAAS